MDLMGFLKIVSWVPEKLQELILKGVVKLGASESYATRMSPLAYWVSVLLLLWIAISLFEKLNVIIKFILFLLIAILVIGFFIPIY